MCRVNVRLIISLYPFSIVIQDMDKVLELIDTRLNNYIEKFNLMLI